jgi:hypothetical protein
MYLYRPHVQAGFFFGEGEGSREAGYAQVTVETLDARRRYSCATLAMRLAARHRCYYYVTR